MQEALLQLVDVVTERLEQLHPATGLHPLSEDWLRGNIGSRCAALLGELAQVDDERLAAEACRTVMAIAWPTGDPDRDDPDWWRTPLGQLCARSFGRDEAETVTQSTAAAMLGVTRGTVAQMVHRGTLACHEEGGVLRSAVLDRIARQP